MRKVGKVWVAFREMHGTRTQWFYTYCDVYIGEHAIMRVAGCNLNIDLIINDLGPDYQMHVVCKPCLVTKERFKHIIETLDWWKCEQPFNQWDLYADERAASDVEQSEKTSENTNPGGFFHNLFKGLRLK